MTDKQINRAIAKACGWRKEDGVYMWTANEIDCTCYELWDWANDLNAMHDAEKTLDEEQWHDYVEHVGGTWEQAMHATARQRAEAFLRTLGRWEATTEESLVNQKKVQG